VNLPSELSKGDRVTIAGIEGVIVRRFGQPSSSTYASNPKYWVAFPDIAGSTPDVYTEAEMSRP
jgi:hypothetical protein